LDFFIEFFFGPDISVFFLVLVCFSRGPKGRTKLDIPCHGAHTGTRAHGWVHGHMDGHTGTRAHGHTGTRAHGHWSPSFGEAAISRDGVGGICVCRSRADCAGGRAVSAGGGAQCARGAGVGVSVGVGIGICIGFAPTAWNWCGGAAASDAGEVCTPWGGQAGGG